MPCSYACPYCRDGFCTIPDIDDCPYEDDVIEGMED